MRVIFILLGFMTLRPHALGVCCEVEASALQRELVASDLLHIARRFHAMPGRGGTGFDTNLILNLLLGGQ